MSVEQRLACGCSFKQTGATAELVSMCPQVRAALARCLMATQDLMPEADVHALLLAAFALRFDAANNRRPS